MALGDAAAFAAIARADAAAIPSRATRSAVAKIRRWRVSLARSIASLAGGAALAGREGGLTAMAHILLRAIDRKSVADVDGGFIKMKHNIRSKVMPRA
ncbi:MULTISPECIES: hypothetical protein [Caulobacter]|uniref:hypothetical protein n=1 Tax=Caulobacter TaxID=75 RepID=UPI0013F42A6F|nr:MULTISPECIES: hypothetical protein [Caulobacter]MBQ1563147.1 hypothetical protein [Caulobacter sp.]